MKVNPHQSWRISEKVVYRFARLLSYLPVELVSDIGAFLGRIYAQRAMSAKRLWVDRLLHNLDHYCELNNPKERKKHLVKFIENLGRIYAEFMVQQKIVEQGRITFDGKEVLDAIDHQVIIASCHLSNWELMGHVAASLKRPTCDLYLPRKSRVLERLALEARERWPIPVTFIPAAPSCYKAIVRELQQGHNFGTSIDEMKDGYVMSPSLGRDIADAGNRIFMARLAVKQGIDILPAYILPNGKGRYKAVIKPLIRVADLQGDDATKVKSIADQLNQIMDKAITENIEHWYWFPFFDAKAKPKRQLDS